jgi:hypothetical protein
MCEGNMQKAIQLLNHLGFIMNYEKCSLTAQRRCKYLGFIIDSIDFSLNLTDKRKTNNRINR